MCWYQIKINNKFIRSLKFRGFAKRIQCVNRGLVKVESVLSADFHRRGQGIRFNTERDHTEVDPFDNFKPGSPNVKEILRESKIGNGPFETTLFGRFDEKLQVVFIDSRLLAHRSKSGSIRGRQSLI